jgi:hypothetical protein
MRQIGMMATVMAVLAIGPLFANPADCPELASAKVTFEVVDESGRAVAGARVLFTASNWDSTLSYISDSKGRVDVLCVPPGPGYDVTVIQPAYATAHVSASASDRPQTVRIVLHRARGRYVQVKHGGWPIPGVTVNITDSGGESRVVTTNGEGVATYSELSGEREATFDVSLDGFVSQKATLSHEHKNGPLLFELTIVPVCTPMRVR